MDSRNRRQTEIVWQTELAAGCQCASLQCIYSSRNFWVIQTCTIRHKVFG